MITIKVPARICFFGDHQDYLGLPVIAGAIDRFINLKGTKNTEQKFNINLQDIGTHISLRLDDVSTQVADGDYFRSGMALLKKQGLEFQQGYDISISGNIPINAGLSSSSALVVTWIKFLIAVQETAFTFKDTQIGQLAYEAEVVYFKQPGGLMDQYTIAQRGMLYIHTQSGESNSLSSKIGTIIVAESSIKKQTLEVLKNAKEYALQIIATVKEHDSSFDISESSVEDYQRYLHIVPEEYRAYWYASIFNFDITKKAKQEFKKDSPDVEKIGILMNQHQGILQNQIQNTPSKMIKMMDKACKSGAYGAKIIGSGGGGCMVALTDENSKSKVIEAFLDAGAVKAYEVKIYI
ncbi:mevalonate kinase [Croceitalea sp. MTPC9]|uniref:mevalonate kinase family protein n=1 Tax=unclassified Croceitalea TaxID=2632280 RepID=UPI002B38DE1A|nr:mevalonate kinase [Croceitalea sp. MTPC6]GMN18274.1 mevalonate kinase [Croceitalea sp. MTPC9]